MSFFVCFTLWTLGADQISFNWDEVPLSDSPRFGASPAPQVILGVCVLIKEVLDPVATFIDDFCVGIIRQVVAFSWVGLHVVQFIRAIWVTPGVFPAVISHQARVFKFVEYLIVPCHFLSQKCWGITLAREIGVVGDSFPQFQMVQYGGEEVVVASSPFKYSARLYLPGLAEYQRDVDGFFKCM